MARKRKKNHGARCRGVFRGTRPCTLARDGSGARWLNKPCLVCKEQRCKKHCLCGKKKEQKVAAVSKAVSKASPALVPALAPVAVVAPVGHPPAPSCELLETAGELIQRVCTDIATAGEVELSTYMYTQFHLKTSHLEYHFRGGPE